MATNPKAIDGNIYIAIDPGYNATKVCVNGLLFSIPASIVDITGKLQNYITEKAEGYILSRYVRGKDYLIGEHARALLMEPDVQEIMNQKSGMLESYEKFETEESQINILTAIGMALIKYEEACKRDNLLPEIDLSQPIDNNSSVTLYVGIALPNDAASKIWTSVHPRIVGHHQFEIETNTGVHNLDFTIYDENCGAGSQVEEAFMGYIMDDGGYALKERMDAMLPALIIDGGYKTIADMKYMGIGMIVGAESNTEFAMGNIYKKVADELHEKYGRADIHAYNIGMLNRDELAERAAAEDEIAEELKKPVEINYIDGDEVKSVDMRALIEAETDDTFNAYVEYLNEKYNKLLEIKSILVCGGTGKRYYERLCEYIDNHRQNLKGKVLLADYEFLGEKIQPVYAICIGMYKHLKCLKKS